MGAENAYINNDMSASILMVLRYYGETFSSEELADLNSAFFDPEDLTRVFTFSDVQEYLKKRGYGANVFEISSARDIRPSLNRNLPIIMRHSLDVYAESPRSSFRPMGVVVGVENNGENILLHDFYLGFSKEINFDRLLVFAGQDNGKSLGMVVEPKEGWKPAVSEGKTWIRTETMNQAEYYINLISFARIAQSRRQWELSNKILRPIAEDPLFEEVVPPYYRIIVYSIVAGGYIFDPNNRNYVKAEQLTQKAETINHDLDKPFSDYWPGFLDMTNLVHGVSDGPHVERGFLHFYRDKNYDAAIDSFKKALEIWPHDVDTQKALNMALSAKKASAQ